MAKVITVSRTFPAYHPKKGQPTNFVQKIWNSFGVSKNYDLLKKDYKGFHNTGFKHHTIRAGKRWKNGDMASLRVWSARPYNSKQIVIADDVKVNVYDFEIKYDGINGCMGFFINDISYSPDQLEEVAENDGLERHDLQAWFKYPNAFSGQIICWNKKIKYKL